MKIVFYISNHGFGHASRCIPIINNLMKINDKLEVIIKSDSEQIDFIKSLIKEKNRVKLYKQNIDLGLVLKENRCEIDNEKLKEKIIDYVNSWDILIQNEIEFLKEQNIRLIISDIVPWVFDVSKKLNIKSLLISNFIWTDIYEEIIESNIIDKFNQMYDLVDYVFYYPLSTKRMRSLKNSQSVGFSVREYDDRNIERIKQTHNRPIIYFSLGRSVDIDIEINVDNLPFDFYFTEGINITGQNAFKLEKSTVNTHDYIGASDLVITKAGWSTVAEAICSKKPMLVLERKDNSEDMNTIENLNRYSIIKTFTIDDLLDKQNFENLIRSTIILKQNYIYLKDLCNNDSVNIARKINIMINEGMKNE